MPKPIYEGGDIIVLWNQAVHTDKEVTANRPDIIIQNTKEKTCTLIDVAKPADRNAVQREAEKKLYTRWFKYDQDYLCVNKPVTVLVIFEPPCTRVYV